MKGFTIISMLVLTTLMISSIAFMYHYKTNNSSSQRESTLEESKLVWQTGESKTEDFQITFKYPSNWNIGGSPDKILMRPSSSENRPYYSINMSIKYKLASNEAESNKSKFVLSKEQGNYLVEITAGGTDLEMIKNDEILKEIYASLVFTYIKEDCGNVIENAQFSAPTDWTSSKTSPCSKTITYYPTEKPQRYGLSNSIEVTVNEFKNDTKSKIGRCILLRDEQLYSNVKNLTCNAFKGNPRVSYGGGCGWEICTTNDILYKNKIYTIKYYPYFGKDVNLKRKFYSQFTEFLDNIQFK